MSLIFNDTFTVGGDVNLEAHTPDTGTSWTELWATTAGTGYDDIASTDIAQQQLGTGKGVIYTADATYDSADYYVQTTINKFSNLFNVSIYLFVRIQDKSNLYAVKLTDGNGIGTSQLYKKVSGTWTALGSAFDTPAVGSIVKLEIVGSTLTFYDDGVSVATATDSAITATGKAGLGGGGGVELVTSADDLNSSTAVDDFSVTTTVAFTTSTSSTSSSISTSSTSSSISTSTSRSTSTSSTSSSLSTSSTSTSITTTTSTSTSLSTSTSSTSTSISTSSTSTSLSTSTTTLIVHDVWPHATIKHQSQLSGPTVSDSTLVDDTVALVDDPTAVVGGQLSTNPDMIPRVKNTIPRAQIRIRH